MSLSFDWGPLCDYRVFFTILFLYVTIVFCSNDFGVLCIVGNEVAMWSEGFYYDDMIGYFEMRLGDCREDWFSYIFVFVVW